MPKINFKSDILPHLIAVAVFIVVVVIFYHPLFFSNKSMYQHDVLQGKGGGQEAVEFRQETGEEALWINSMFSGMPAYMVNIYWSGDLLEYVQKIITLGFPGAPSVTFLSLISFYVLMLTFGVRPYVAIIGALAFGFNTFQTLSIEAGHIWKIRAVAYMPLVLAGFKLLYDQKKIYLGAALTSLGLALEIKANHPQITYYLLLILSCYGISQLVFAIKNKTISYFTKSTVIMLLATLLAFTANIGRLWTTYEYSQYSTRGPSELTTAQRKGESGLDRDYVFHWSEGKLESLTLLVPGFSGGASQESLDMDSKFAQGLSERGVQPQQVAQFAQGAATYWGAQPGVGGPYYMGAIVLTLFILGIFFVAREHKIWLISATILGLLLAWGKNLEWFNYFMYDYFPYYNKFRAVTMALAIVIFTIPILGTLGLDKALDIGSDKARMKKLFIALGIGLGSCLLIWLYGAMASFRGPVDANFSELPPWFLDTLKDQRQYMLQSDAIRSFFFILLAAVTIIFILRKKVNTTVGTALIVGLVFLDLFLVGRRYLNGEDYQRRPKSQFFQLTAADQQVKKEADTHYRVLNLANAWGEARTSYHHSSLGGYHGAKMQRYQELIDYCLDDQKNEVIQKLRAGSIDFQGLNILNMLNTTYFMYGNEANTVVPNTAAFGNAWLINEVQKVNSADEELAATCKLPNQATAIIDVSKFELSQTTFNSNGSAKLIAYQPNYLKYEVDAKGKSLVAFSEIYYPEGWIAKIDGNKVGHLRLNYTLRGLEVPTGKHVVEFEFRPDSYFIGNKIMMASSGLLILLVLGALTIQFASNKNMNKSTEA
ncbi:MAG: YfhO family protein [Bacteroidota bacterium]